MHRHAQQPEPERDAPRYGTGDALPSYGARDLTGHRGEAKITLDDQTYTLRITRAGKLILTK